MWPEWLKSPIRTHRRSKSSSRSFSCSTFKDLQSILKEDSESEPDPVPGSPRSPTVFHRVRVSTSLFRSWAHRHLTSSPPQTLRIANQGIVLYFTSLRVVRRTFEDCRVVRSILRGYRVPIDERDLSMDSNFLYELQGIFGGCNSKRLSLPMVFISGWYVGGAEEIRRLNETGELAKIVSGLHLVGSPFCDFCGGLRFVLCDECNGSHKVYTEKRGFSSCTRCNVNGLIRCPSCCLVHRRSTRF